MDQWTVQALAGSSWAGGEKYWMLKDRDTALWTAWPWIRNTRKQALLLQEQLPQLQSVEGVFTISMIKNAPHVLYTVSDIPSDYTCLADAILDENKTFTPSFLWNLLRQLATIAKRLSLFDNKTFGRKIAIDCIYFDNTGAVKVAPFYPLCSVDDLDDCKNLMCDIGKVFDEILSNTTSFRELVAVTKLIKGHGKACARKPESILYHPTVLCHIEDGNIAVFEESFKKNDSAFESDNSQISLSLNRSNSLNSIPLAITPVNQTIENNMENKPLRRKATPLRVKLSPTVVALDLNLPGYVPKRRSSNMNEWHSKLELVKKPEEVTEEALNRVWLERLAALREREEALNRKELEIGKKKVLDKFIASEASRKPRMATPTKPDMAGVTLQTVMTHKVIPVEKIKTGKRRLSSSDASVGSRGDSDKSRRHSHSMKTRSRKKKAISYVDMDSSLSADQGDASILPTSTKMNADRVHRPASIRNISRRKVHFNSQNNPFEYDSVSSTTLTFFEIEDPNKFYEVPVRVPNDAGDIADRIAKFTYLDLEEMTEKKRALMDNIKNSPPKTAKPSLHSKVKTAEMIRKFGGDLKNNQQNSIEKEKALPKPSENRRKTICNLLSGKENIQPKKTENFATPAPPKAKDKRKSILGFKTPFKFRL